MNMKHMLRTIGTVLCVAGTVLSVAPGTAQAMEGLSIEINGTKGQFIHGALLGIPVLYTCPPGSTFPNISVQLFQASGKEVTNGFGFEEDLLCDGDPQETMIFVLPGSSSSFRRSKDVVVDVTLSACDELAATCANASDGPVVLPLRR
jgi:hypothetical protein